MRCIHRFSGVALLSLISALVFTTPARAVNSARAALDSTTPSVKLESVTLKDAIQYVEDISGANVHVDWKSLEAAGVGKDAVINLRLRGVALSKALAVILSEAGGGNDLLTFYVADNVIEITTREVADHVLVTRVYPIDDLLVDVPDFVGPSFSISSNNSSGSNGKTPGQGGGGGSSSSSGNMFGNGGSSQNNATTVTKTQKAQQIIDLITAIVRPDVWQVNGGKAAIRFFNGSLIITAPRSVHEAIDGSFD